MLMRSVLASVLFNLWDLSQNVDVGVYSCMFPRTISWLTSYSMLFHLETDPNSCIFKPQTAHMQIHTISIYLAFQSCILGKS